MRSRSLGVIFIAAVIVPSILLAFLSIRSAGREEAWMEKQMAATLDAEVTHTAALAAAELGRLVDDLRTGLDVPAGSDYGRILARWKGATPVVAVPFLLSPRYGILWPPSDARADAEQKQFLKENGDFLSDRTATTVLQNIAVRYQAEILTESSLARRDASGPAGGAPADGYENPGQVVPPAAAPAPAQARHRHSGHNKHHRQQQAAPAPAAKQRAIDAFAQDPRLQSKVYEEAREKGDQLNARVVEPMAASPSAPMAAESEQAGGAAAVDGEAQPLRLPLHLRLPRLQRPKSRPRCRATVI